MEFTQGLMVIFQAVLTGIVLVIGWSIKTIYKNVEQKIELLTTAVGEISDCAMERKISDSANQQIMLNMQSEIKQHNVLLAKQFDKIEGLVMKVCVLENWYKEQRSKITRIDEL